MTNRAVPKSDTSAGPASYLSTSYLPARLATVLHTWYTEDQTMDKPREGVARARLIRRIVTTVLVVLAVGATTVALSRLQPAAPTVQASTVWRDTVKRGEMLRIQSAQKSHQLNNLEIPDRFVYVPADFPQGDPCGEMSLIVKVCTLSTVSLGKMNTPQTTTARLLTVWTGDKWS